MTGCKEPGSKVYLSEQNGKGRKLPFTWELIRVGRTLMGINTLAANRLVKEGIVDGIIEELQGYETLRPEFSTRPGTRLDFFLERPDQQCYVEVKNVTLVADGLAMFPDAVTERGTKHLKELMRLKRAGHRAVLVFVIQSGDSRAVRKGLDAGANRPPEPSTVHGVDGICRGKARAVASLDHEDKHRAMPSPFEAHQFLEMFRATLCHGVGKHGKSIRNERDILDLHIALLVRSF